MRVTYLTGEHVYLRPLSEADKDVAIAWWPNPFLANAVTAHEWLTKMYRGAGNNLRWYAIIRTSDDTVVGSARLISPDQRQGVIMFRMSPTIIDADMLQADALRVVVPWVQNDLEMMVLTLLCAADEVETITVAHALGMEESVRFREFIARPGYRVDQLYLAVSSAPWRTL